MRRPRRPFDRDDLQEVDPYRYDRLKSFDNVRPVIDGFWNFVKITMSSLTLLTAFGICVLTIFVWIDLAKVPNLSELERYNAGAALALYDANDKLISEFPAEQQREVVRLCDISPNLTRAVLTAEDHNFFEHHGVSVEGILRAAVANLSAGKQVQGGSTLTQQLVKNVFFENQQRTIPLKLAESLVAGQIENRYSKEKILEIYLNQIYFGSGAYGIEQAARAYFGKHATELSIGESAYLAGLIKSPSVLSAPGNRGRAMERQQYVLRKMHEYGFINDRDIWDAQHERMIIFNRKPKEYEQAQFVPRYPYYSNYVASMVTSSIQYRRHKGLKVYTNLDPKAQQAAEQTLNAYQKHLPRGIDQAALASLRLSDGAVVALVGGVGPYLSHQWNSAVHPHTMGSAFKPFVYLTAFEQRIMTPNSQISDAPLTILDEGNVWEPANFDKKYMGIITVEQALAYSRNVCSIRCAQQTGVGPIIDTASRAGIRDKLASTLSLALGSSASSPLSMANAYATIARGGMYEEPQFIRRVEDERGNVIVTNSSVSVRSLDLDATTKLVEVLIKVVESGTGTRARLPGIPVAGKTGTADDGRDLWFVGFTPDLVTAVWAGNSQHKPVYGMDVTGGHVPAVMWKNYNMAYYRTHPKPKEHLICVSDGKLQPLSGPGSISTQTPIIASPDMEAIEAANQPRPAPPPQPKPVAKPASGTGVTEYHW